MTALIDWHDDASLPSRTHSWPMWMLAMALAGVGSAAIVVAVIGGVTSVGRSGCGLHEAREGMPDLEKIDVPVPCRASTTASSW
jgi:hypothetical protein